MSQICKEVTKTVTKEYDEKGNLVKETEITKEIEYIDRPQIATTIPTSIPKWGEYSTKWQPCDGGITTVQCIAKE